MLFAESLLVSAAASLTDVFTELGRGFTPTPRFNFGASGALAQQIRGGAPVDVFAAASSKEIDELVAAKRLIPDTRVDFASNRLVLIVPVASRLKGWDDLRSTSLRRVALSNPASVPSGRYAQQTLEKRGLWTSLNGKTVLGENVRQTLAYVANGDADAGLVFATDAQIAKNRVRVMGTAVPGTDHTPILYPAAVIANSPREAEARRFVLFLRSTTAQTILKRFGFGPPPKP